MNKENGIPPNHDFIDARTERICETYADNVAVNHNERHNLPRESEILENLDRILELIFPGFSGQTVHSPATLKYAVGDILALTFVSMRGLIYRVNKYLCKRDPAVCDCLERAEKAEEKAEAARAAVEEFREGYRTE